jgi:hypothetical protein
VVELFAFLHDSRRLSDGHDPDHGARAAEFARTLAGSAFELEAADLELLATGNEYAASAASAWGAAPHGRVIRTRGDAQLVAQGNSVQRRPACSDRVRFVLYSRIAAVAARSCTVVIGSIDLLGTLKGHAGDSQDEVLTFSDADALRALEVISKRKPRLVALDRFFAATPRGVALINRIKADPALTNAEVRVVSHDSPVMQVPEGCPDVAIQRDAGRAGERAKAPGAAQEVEVLQVVSASKETPALAAVPPAPSLDFRATRRAPRFRMQGPVGVLIDGGPATLVDVSTLGAQVVSSVALKPNQRVRLALNDEQGSVRFNAAVAWASFEIPPRSGPRYRAGLEFVDADAPAVDAFCRRHRG